MFRLFLAISLICTSLSAIAQNIEIDKKTGFVKVDGKDAFFLVQKNKSVFNADYSLQNLNHEELAYIKPEQVDKFNSYTNKYDKELMFNFTFVQTGNSCLVKSNAFFNNPKGISKVIAAANLIENNQISPESERKFIVMNKGNFLKDPNGDNNKVVVNVVNNDKPVKTSGPADISLKENKVYNSGELVGSFRRSSDNGYTLIQIYTADGSKAAEAKHLDANENDDWNVKILSDGKTITLLYDSMNPLEKLFKYLVEKGYL